MQWTANVVREVLPNGLTVLVQRDTSAPVVAVVTHVRAGYFDEPDEWVGISHVLEHMYFKGTGRRGPGDVARETQLLGGYCNAGTIYDKTVYYTVLPSADGGLARALDLQADALMHAALDPEELAREIEVIVQEAKRKKDSPEAVTVEALFAVLFRRHRMRRWRIGTEAGLRQLTVSDLRNYYESRYAPGRVILGIAGTLDVDETLTLARGCFGAWERATEAIEGSPQEPPGRHAALDVRRGDVGRSLLAMGWRTVDTLHPDAAPLDVAAALLSTGRSARLYRGLREPGLVNAVGASHYTPTEVGVFSLSLETEAALMDRAASAALAHVTLLADTGPSDVELTRVRRQLATRWARQFESVDGRASALCAAEAVGGVAILDQQYAAMLGVNARDVQRVTAQFLGPEQVSGALYLPSDARVAVESAWPPPSPIVSLPSVTVRDRASNSASAPVSVESDREYAGAVHRRRLANIDVVVRRRGGTGLVNVGLHVAGISDSETRETAGLTRLVGRCSVRGAGGMDGSELAEASERLGGAITPVVGRDAMGWSMTVPAEALADAVRLVALVAEQPEFAPAAVAVERELQAGDAKRARDDMFQYPLEQVLGQAYPTHAYGLPSLGLPEQVREFGVDQVRAWHQQLHGAPAAVVVVGDVHPSSALDEVSEALRWTGVPAEPIAPVTPVWCADCAYEERHKLQSALAMAFPAAASTAREREYLSVLCALLSGLAGRLFDELRERRSLAYTVAAMRWQARVAGALLTYVATSPEREDEARQAAVEVLRGVADTPPDNEEFRRASNYAGGLLAISRQHATSVADELVEAWVTDTLELPGERAERLRAVTVADVVALSERLAGAERAEFVVRGTSARG